MKQLKNKNFLVTGMVLAIAMIGCSSTIQLQKEAPAIFDDVYFQKWTSGIQEGGSGINLHITIRHLNSQTSIDSVYFRGKGAALRTTQDQHYLAEFKTAINQPNDIVMSVDISDEYGNQLPKTETKIPFELNEDECVISYLQDRKRFYYKITNLLEKPALNYPSAPPNKQ